MMATVATHGQRHDEVTQMLREVGPAWHLDIRAAGDRTKAFYLPRLRAASREGVEIVRDQPYGPHARQVLDLYVPAGARNAPVVVFVHGGAFVRGSKDINDQMYGNVLTWFARRGYVGVNVEYRLAPEATYPGGALDVAAACAFVTERIGGWGGDAARVCLIGHSAGGTHAASFVYDPQVSSQAPGIESLVLISARLFADVLDSNPNAAGVRAYFGDDASRYDTCSPLTHAHRQGVPALIANAEFENPWLDVYSVGMAWKIGQACGRAPRHLTLADHNHVSIMAHFNTEEEQLGEAILDFIESVRR